MIFKERTKMQNLESFVINKTEYIVRNNFSKKYHHTMKVDEMISEAFLWLSRTTKGGEKRIDMLANIYLEHGERQMLAYIHNPLSLLFARLARDVSFRKAHEMNIGDAPDISAEDNIQQISFAVFEKGFENRSIAERILGDVHFEKSITELQRRSLEAFYLDKLGYEGSADALGVSKAVFYDRKKKGMKNLYLAYSSKSLYMGRG